MVKTDLKYWVVSLKEIIVYLTRKLNQKPIILTFNHIEQLMVFFFIDHKMVVLTSQIKQKYGQPKILI